MAPAYCANVPYSQTPKSKTGSWSRKPSPAAALCLFDCFQVTENTDHCAERVSLHRPAGYTFHIDALQSILDSGSSGPC